MILGSVSIILVGLVATIEGVLDRELLVTAVQQLLARVRNLRTESELLAIEGQRCSIFTDNMVLVPALIQQVMNRISVSNVHLHILLILVVSRLHVEVVVT